MNQQDEEYTIAYHGTSAGDLIQKEGFNISTFGSAAIGEGVYATTDYGYAELYAKKSGQFINKQAVLEVTLKEKNILSLDGVGDLWNFVMEKRKLDIGIDDVYRQYKKNDVLPYAYSQKLFPKDVVKYANNEGYGGVRVRKFDYGKSGVSKDGYSDALVIFNPKKVVVTKNNLLSSKTEKTEALRYFIVVNPIKNKKSESSELQKAETYKPTEAMAEEARRALKWKAEGNAGGTRVGLARANQLAKRENLSESTVKRMFSFFSRHEVDKQGKGFYPGEGYPSKGRVAWALWGGDAGFSWSKNIVERLKEKG